MPRTDWVEWVKERLSKDREGEPISGPHFSNRSYSRSRGSTKGEKVYPSKRKRLRKISKASRRRNR